MQKNFWIIWGAFVSSIIIYIVIAYTMISRVTSPDIADSYMYMTAIITIICSIISAISSIILRAKLINSSIEDGTLDIKSEEGLKKYLTLSVINWVLSESIAVFGLIMMVLSGVFYYVIPYCVVSIALLIIHIPRFES